MSASSDKSLQITCPRYLHEVAKFNFVLPNVIYLARFAFLESKYMIRDLDALN